MLAAATRLLHSPTFLTSLSVIYRSASLVPACLEHKTHFVHRSGFRKEAEERSGDFVGIY
jgi:hypothetical protein